MGRGDFMAREKITIKKIDNIAARQVTFSKRRRGLFKKAQELGVLCDADVAVIVFSSTGKRFEYSSSSMKELLEKYSLHTRNTEKTDQSSLELQDTDHVMLSKQVAERTKQLRQMMGEDLEGLSLGELQQLEKILETGLSCVLQTKGDRIMNEITTLQEKSAQLIEENLLLKQKMAMITKGKWPLANGNAATDHQTSDNVISGQVLPLQMMIPADDQCSESITNSAPPADDDSSDTCLKLRLSLF